MGVAGCGWSGFASSFFLGHLDITVHLTFLEMHSLIALAGSAVSVLTIWQRQNFAACEGTGMGMRQSLGSNPTAPICPGTSAEMVSSSSPWWTIPTSFPSRSLKLGTSFHISATPWSFQVCDSGFLGKQSKVRPTPWHRLTSWWMSYPSSSQVGGGRNVMIENWEYI